MTIALLPETQAMIDLAHASSTCAQWAQAQGWTLRRTGAELIGGCPVCGGTDRFSINVQKNVWNCRVCGVGGDVIFLVMHTEKLTLLPACERITGRTMERAPDPAETARLAERRSAEAREQAATAARYRERARKDAYEIWKAGKGHLMDLVARYLGTIRGLAGGAIDFGAPDWAAGLPIRLQPQRTYFHNGRAIHNGPAMLAAIVGPDGHFSGIHQTWLDLERPKGKLVLPEVDGKALPAKKVLGVKKGGAIRLLTPPRLRRLVMGEGIETTATPMVFAPVPDTGYWAGVDLGNLSGKAARYASGGMAHDQPDMTDRDCFLPPDEVEELIYLCEGDEPEKHTVEKVMRGLRRAQRLRREARQQRPELADLRIGMVPPGQVGTDLNSLVMGGEIEVEDERPEGLTSGGDDGAQ